MGDALHTLTERLRELPGIGPRQARRLAHWLAEREHGWVQEFSHAVIAARRDIGRCDTCMRLFPMRRGERTCELCTSPDREPGTILVVERDVDLENIERTGTYRGRYFVLGGTTGPLDKEPEKKVRVKELKARILDGSQVVREVILACSATTEGEETADYVRDYVKDAVMERAIAVSELGRGLSTGTELEYVDADTMKNALRGRSKAQS